jgi:uncharacterized membrane protein
LSAPHFPSNLKKLTAITLCCFYTNMVYAQDQGMAEALRESGKIYIVVGVVLLIFVGILIYLIRMDRKISKLEALNREDKTEDQ